MSWQTHQNPPRPSHPKELLKHRFIPFGSSVTNADKVDTSNAMDVDEAPKDKDNVPKVKRRKLESEASPKKTKKTRAIA